MQKVDSQKRSVLCLPNSGDVATGFAVGVYAQRFPGSGIGMCGRPQSVWRGLVAPLLAGWEQTHHEATGAHSGG
jgi:hypothetical protein